MFQELRASFVVFIFFMLVTGFGYPLVVTQAGEALFPFQASGSLTQKDGKIIGSTLLGQTFKSEGYFHGRPSAAGDGYDASNSSGSNLAPTATDLLKTYQARVVELRKAGIAPIPVDMITASGSGLDPDISVANATFQEPRIAAARHISTAALETLIAAHTTPRMFGILGENRINVLELNQALDLLAPLP